MVIAVGVLAVGSVYASGLADAASPPRIQVAILLDTSNSMDGLIAQAKTQLWRVVNEFIPARKGGRRPTLEVALFEYGNSGLSERTGHIRQVLPLTNDLDRVSEELFALQTNGGDEYCGMVIKRAVDELEWSKSAGDLKTIFIAGNEPFTQGPVDYREACREAVSKGITINTVHCPESNQSGEAGGWRDGAQLADGAYTSIDQNYRAEAIPAPQDGELQRLGGLLNQTYVPFGVAGARGLANQAAQDSNAIASAPGSAVQRAITKSSQYYMNSSWDLVDAVRQGEVELARVNAKDLPEPMRTMNLEQRRAFLDEKSKQRADLQAEVRQLNQERQKHIQAEMKRRAASGEDTLDSAIIGSIRRQAAQKNFKVAQ
jgi:hypothetical protein